MSVTHQRRKRLAARVAGPIAALLLAAAPALAGAATGKVAWVADGDTFRLESGERIRISGIDSPETQPGQAKCQRELVFGAAARDRARALLTGRVVTVTRLDRSYRRTVAQVALDGRDLAATLVSMGVARWWPRGRPRPDWCGVSR
ncbi:MAG: thermonuclease family protein [Qipengyuania sp.]|nr:thermonuclease family protein [Qipengyuania sp.]